MQLLKQLIITSALIGMCVPAIAEINQRPHSIVVITDDAHPVTSLPFDGSHLLDIKVYSLDAVSKVESTLSLLLPNDESQALEVMQARIAQIGQARLEQDLANAYKGLTVAMSYDIDRYPAIIFDEDTVIYGLTDLSLATQKYIQWMEEIEEGRDSE